MRLLTVVAAAAIVAAGVLAGGLGAVDSAVSSVGDASEDAIDAIEADVNATAVERQVHAEINAERRARGLEPLAYREGTAARAADHTASMAEAGELSHATLDEQYRCEPAGENVAYTYVAQDIVTDDGRAVNHHGNESSIAKGIVGQWMNSRPHRENLLNARFSGEGIGVVVADTDEGQRVYVTQALCG
jgi:uncharacterized protein YkwD